MNDFLFVLPLQEAFNLGSYFGVWTSDDYLSDIKLLLPNFVLLFLGCFLLASFAS